MSDADKLVIFLVLPSVVLNIIIELIEIIRG